MIAVCIDCLGGSGHSYRIEGRYAESLALWHVLRVSALSFLSFAKHMYPQLQFKVQLQLGKDAQLEPTLLLHVISTNDEELTQKLFTQFIHDHSHLLQEL